MPLLDHFHPPIKKKLGWSSLHSGWATYLATNLIDNWLPPPYLAVENTHRSMAIEIDVATFEAPVDGAAQGGAVVALPRLWTAPAPLVSTAVEFAGAYEVLIYADEDGWKLVGAIELVSEKNKDRPSRRHSFVGKCAGLLEQGISVVIMDIVTCRLANLHNELLQLLGIRTGHLSDMPAIYTSAYHPVERAGQSELDVWAEPLQIGSPLPTMPLRLNGEVVVPIEFEATYTEICRRRKVI